MYEFIKKFKFLSFLSFLLILLYGSMEIVKSILIGQLFDNPELTSVLHNGIAIILLFICVYLLVMVIQQLCSEILRNKIRYALNQELYKSYLNMPLSSFTKTSQSNLLNIFNNKIEIVVEQYIRSNIQILFYIVSFCVGSIYIGSINYIMLIFLYICGLLTVLLNISFSPKLKKNQKSLLSGKEHWIKSIQNMSLNFYSIRNYQKENWIVKQLDLANHDICKKQFLSNGYLSILSMLNNGVGQCMFFGTILMGMVLINSSLLTVGTLIAIIQASNLIINPIVNYINLRNTIHSTKPIYMELKKYVEENKETESKILDHNLNKISLIDLSFKYQDTYILNNITYSFERGKKYLILGKSGAGKSTLLSLLTKQIKSNDIYVNDYLLSDIRYSSYISEIGYIMQNEHLFTSNLAENIALDTKYNIKDIYRIMDIVKLNGLKDRVFDDMDENASTISGGQKQKIAIARALYHQKNWLFLDESFSSMDAHSEQEIEKYLLHQQNMSIVLITHKINKDIYPLFDKILYLSEGTLKEISDYSYSEISSII